MFSSGVKVGCLVRNSCPPSQGMAVGGADVIHFGPVFESGSCCDGIYCPPVDRYGITLPPCTDPCDTSEPGYGEYVYSLCIVGDMDTPTIQPVIKPCSAPVEGVEFVSQRCAKGSIASNTVGRDTTLIACKWPTETAYVSAVCISGNVLIADGKDTQLHECSKASVDNNPEGTVMAYPCVHGSPKAIGYDTVFTADSVVVVDKPYSNSTVSVEEMTEMFAFMFGAGVLATVLGLCLITCMLFILKCVFQKFWSVGAEGIHLIRPSNTTKNHGRSTELSSSSSKLVEEDGDFDSVRGSFYGRS